MEPWQFYAANIVLTGVVGATTGVVVLVKRGLANEPLARQRPYTIGGAALGAALGAVAAWAGETYMPGPPSTLYDGAYVDAAPAAQPPAPPEGAPARDESSLR